MRTGDLGLSLSTCVLVGCAAWCCVSPLLQGQYRAAEQRVSLHLALCPFCFPVIPVLGVAAPLGAAHCRCGTGVHVHKMLVHHPDQCSPR